VRQWHAHTRLLISLANGAAAFALMPPEWSIQTRLIAGYDAGAGLFLVLAWPVMWWATTAHMQERARIEDQGRWAVLALAVTSAAEPVRDRVRASRCRNSGGFTLAAASEAAHSGGAVLGRRALTGAEGSSRPQ
jgi:hypothetical protein